MGREWVSLRVQPETVAYAHEVAAENDETVSAVLRHLLALGVAAHQGRPAAAVPAAPKPQPQPRPTPALATVDTPGPKPQAWPCSMCGCSGYTPGQGMMRCRCGHIIGYHKQAAPA